MRPLLAWALLCIPPKIAALQAPSHGARPFSRPSIAPRSMLRLEADDDCLSNFWRFWGRISDPLNAPSPQTGLSLIQSFENAFAAGRKVACYDGLEQVGKGLERFGLILAFIAISVAPTVPTWMKSVLWRGRAGRHGSSTSDSPASPTAARHISRPHVTRPLSCIG